MLTAALRSPDTAPVRTGPRKLATGANPYLEAPARIMRMANLGADVRLYDVSFVDPALADSFNFARAVR